MAKGGPLTKVWTVFQSAKAWKARRQLFRVVLGLEGGHGCPGNVGLQPSGGHIQGCWETGCGVL